MNYYTPFLFTFLLVSSLVFVAPSTQANSDPEQLILKDVKIGNRQHKYTLNITKITDKPLNYTFDIVSYERSYKYAGKIKWRHYPTFPHGEGTLTEIFGTDQLNITGWLGENILPGQFYGLMSRFDQSDNATKYWMIVKTDNPRRAMYGTYTTL